MATKARKRGPEHVYVANNVMLCDHCGARQELTLPQPMGSVAAMLTAWSKAHAKCTGNTVAFRRATSLGDWIRSDDTGMSSQSIYSHMRGAFVHEAHTPRDPDDFGRCYRLLALAPDWRARIGEMATYGAEWAALAGAWDELTALYEEEVGPEQHGRAPKMYARMCELRGES